MADLDVSPVIQNGGAGSVQVGGVRAPDYRQVVEPARVNTDLPSNEGARRAQALRQAFTEFGGLGASVYKDVTSQAGAIAGAASGATGHPAYKEGLARLTAYGRAFNNAATGSYAIEAEAQADDAAARLRVQANNDPTVFAKTFSAVRDGVLKEAPALAQPILTELYNRKLAEGIAAISGDQAAEQKQLQAKTWEMGIQRQTSRVADLQGRGDPISQAKAADEQVKLNLLIEGGVKSGLYSPAEAQAMRINAMRTITKQVFETQFDRELANPDGHPIELLEKFRDMHLANLQNSKEPTVFSEDEFNQLMSTAKQKLMQERQIDYYTKMTGRDADEERLKAGDRYYTGKLFDGSLTVKQVHDGVVGGDLSPEVGRTLVNALAYGGAGRGNQDLFFKLHSDPHVLDMKPADIAKYVGPGGLNGEQADRLYQDIQRRNNSWENTVNVKLGKSLIDAALRIPPGTSAFMLSDDERKARTEAQDLYLQQLQALDPAKRDGSASAVAQDVIRQIHQREAAAQVQRLIQGRQNIVSEFGPGSQNPWAKDVMDAWLKKRDADISAAQAAAGLK